MIDPNYVSNVLAEKQVANITIIDDALDPIEAKNIDRTSLEQFWTEVEENAQLTSELKALAIDVKTPEELTDSHMQTLYDQRDSLKGLKPYVRRLLDDEIKARSEVQIIKTNLEELKLRVMPAGTKAQITNNDSQIYLLDYYLGPIAGGEEAAQAVATAVDRAQTIYKQYTGASPRPVILLMSSKELTQEQVREFRKKSKLLGGMFHQIPKSDLANKDRLERKLLALAKSFPVAHAIESLISALERSLLSAVDQFGASIMDLSLEDYVYIQQLSLKEDGQPFGDYLLWLFAADLHKRVFESEDVEQKQQAVDALPMLELPPRQLRPSTELAEMFKSALFRRMPEIAPHPLSSANEPYPLLNLGDIFINDKKELYMVLSPACDLAFSPNSEGRAPSASKTITLIPGKLHPIQKSLPKDLQKPITELFAYNGQTYRIIWDQKRVITCEYGKMNDWIKAGGFRREYLLRLLYALQVQQEYIADFSRIGPPIAPPIFNPVRVELFGYDEKAKVRHLIGPFDDHAALVMSKGSTKCALDLNFLERFCSSIPDFKKNIEARIAFLADLLTNPQAATAKEPGKDDKSVYPPLGSEGDRKEKLNSKIEKCKSHLRLLEEFEADKSAQIGLISLPFDAPELDRSQSLPVPKDLFHVYHEKEITGNYQEQEPFILRLSTIK